MAVRVLLPRVAMFAAGCVILALGQAMSVGAPLGESAATAESRLVVPSWSAVDERQHPECMPSADWPAGRPAAYVVVEAVRDRTHRKLAFDRAWRVNHNGTEVDDVWVLGVCG